MQVCRQIRTCWKKIWQSLCPFFAAPACSHHHSNDAVACTGQFTDISSIFWRSSRTTFWQVRNHVLISSNVRLKPLRIELSFQIPLYDQTIYPDPLKDLCYFRRYRNVVGGEADFNFHTSQTFLHHLISHSLSRMLDLTKLSVMQCYIIPASNLHLIDALVKSASEALQAKDHLFQ